MSIADEIDALEGDPAAWPEPARIVHKPMRYRALAEQGRKAANARFDRTPRLTMRDPTNRRRRIPVEKEAGNG